MSVIDCTLLNNELVLLEKRLKYLYDYVDKFVIVESNYTFSGKVKQLNYLANYKMFEPYRDKIIYTPYIVQQHQYQFDGYVCSGYDPQSPYWQLEYDQRNFAMETLKFFEDSDIVICSDLDEIPNRDIISKLKTMGIPISLSMVLLHYNLLWAGKNAWNGPFAARVQDLRYMTLTNLRHTWDSREQLLNSGWHLSNFGIAGDTISKIESFAHQELNVPENKNPTTIDFRRANKIDLYSGALLDVDNVSFRSYPKDFWSIFGLWMNS